MEESNVTPISKVIQRNFVKPIVSALPKEGGIIEMVYDPASDRTNLCRYQNGVTELIRRIEMNGQVYGPYSAENNLIRNEVILFPSGPQEYGDQKALVDDIRAFIHRYVDIDEVFEHIAACYVLLSWLYDAFNELPYLRIRGDYGTGKSRFLLTVGSLCYRPIFASGASTVSPLFRMLESFRGTLIVDEGDFRFSDERADLVKILNNGNAKGFPILRCETNESREFNPKAYSVFGPKLVAMRGTFDDPALESRFLTEQAGLRPLRSDIPLNLPTAYKDEARVIRNKLLLYRFRNYHQVHVKSGFSRDTVEPRLNQILLPLLSIVEDESIRKQIEALTDNLQRQVDVERSQMPEGQIVGIIRDFIQSGETQLTVHAIAEAFRDRHTEDYDRKISNKWIGTIIRKRLNLSTAKSNGIYCLAPIKADVLARLIHRFGLN